jgi:hypothetical protein
VIALPAPENRLAGNQAGLPAPDRDRGYAKAGKSRSNSRIGEKTVKYPEEK